MTWSEQAGTHSGRLSGSVSATHRAISRTNRACPSTTTLHPLPVAVSIHRPGKPPPCQRGGGGELSPTAGQHEQIRASKGEVYRLDHRQRISEHDPPHRHCLQQAQTLLTTKNAQLQLSKQPSPAPSTTAQSRSDHLSRNAEITTRSKPTPPKVPLSRRINATPSGRLLQ